MIVVVGGKIASGKSTLAKRLSQKLGFSHVSAGSVMRKMASERGMTLVEFSEYAEEHPEVDKEIDERQKAEAVGDCIVDGRLSAYFVDADLKILLTAPIDVRAKRVFERDGNFESFEDAKRALEARENSEKKRYRDFYGIDLDDTSVYDVVIDTEMCGKDEMVEVSLREIAGL
ncbi:MAG TPA: cytidylate kinase [Candidatus Altiarchaeales archaeon]|nr:cytidylate kinase [Candidatus Altiarchaeales archaeon]